MSTWTAKQSCAPLWGEQLKLSFQTLVAVPARSLESECIPHEFSAGAITAIEFDDFGLCDTNENTVLKIRTLVQRLYFCFDKKSLREKYHPAVSCVIKNREKAFHRILSFIDHL